MEKTRKHTSYTKQAAILYVFAGPAQLGDLRTTANDKLWFAGPAMKYLRQEAEDGGG